MGTLFIVLTLALGAAWAVQRDTCRQLDRLSFYGNWYRLFRDIRDNPKYKDYNIHQIDALGDLISYGLYDPLTKKQRILRSILPTLFALSAVSTFLYFVCT
jgi:hypothetical protein